jgi:predicted  nucleic acid-binding Zn-ribbon protein
MIKNISNDIETDRINSSISNLLNKRRKLEDEKGKINDAIENINNDIANLKEKKRLVRERFNRNKTVILNRIK